MQVARVMHVVMPQFERATSRSLRGVNGPAARRISIRCGGRDQGVQRVWEPEHQGMTATPKFLPHGSRDVRTISCAEPVLPSGEADAVREEAGRSTGEARRGTGPSAYTRIVEITSGSTNFQQGLVATCEDRSEERIAESAGGFWWGA